MQQHALLCSSLFRHVCIPTSRSLSIRLPLYATRSPILLPRFYSTQTENEIEDEEHDKKETAAWLSEKGYIRGGKIMIPRDRLTFNFSRSSGAGGQNVNKVNTKAELRFNLGEADWIPDEVKERLAENNANRVNAAGDFVLTSSRHRTQVSNIKDAVEKLSELLDEACIAKKERVATSVPKYATEQRLKDKKIRSETKKARSSRGRDDY